ncbi:MAG: nucleotidyltransferase domain-containing protein [Ignisphaera sp.]
MDSYAVEVIYTQEHWYVLEEKRAKGLKIVTTLNKCGLFVAIVHGSVARGDITRNSDVDVALLHPYSTSLVKLCLEENGFKVYDVKIVQPTPKHTPKVYIYLDPSEERVSLPLAELDPIEIEYYKFSGFVTKEDILAGKRVRGVNKKLKLVIPTEKGHIEIPVIGNEGYVGRLLGVSIDVVKDRVEALTKRIEEGHSGLFIEVSVPMVEEIEYFIEKLCRENSAFRRAVIKHGLCI